MPKSPGIHFKSKDFSSNSKGIQHWRRSSKKQDIAQHQEKHWVSEFDTSSKCGNQFGENPPI